jgi:hypothetical protein
MWIQFAPPVVRWITFGCVVFLGLLLLVMPRHERAQLFRDMRRGRRRRSPSSAPRDLFQPRADGDVDLAGPSQDVWHEDLQPLRDTGRLEAVVRVLILLSATATLALLMWMAIVFLTNLPGWR